jgi:hypothetical protein
MTDHHCWSLHAVDENLTRTALVGSRIVQIHSRSHLLDEADIVDEVMARYCIRCVTPTFRPGLIATRGQLIEFKSFVPFIRLLRSEYFQNSEEPNMAINRTWI